MNPDPTPEPAAGDPTDDTSADARARMTRRGFIGVAGAGAGAAAIVAGTPTVAAAMRSRRGGRGRDDRDESGRRGRRRDGDGGDDRGRFVRMFPELETFAEPSDELTEALTALSVPGGILDANDPLDVGPIRLITEPELSPNNLDNPNNTAGTTFVGQFLDHDITRDAGSNLGRPTSLRRSTNLRSPRFDLDSVYGGGPTESPELYVPNSSRFRVESGGLFEDLPRTADSQAIIADPRNDENMILSGLQAAFLLFHNAVLERVEAGNLAGADAFDEARRLVRWHWQWIIVNEYLPQIVPADVLQNVLTDGPRFFAPTEAAIPVEFQTAAYRFGHSQVRPSYRANLAGDDGEAFFALVFDGEQLGQPDPETLAGGHRAPRRFIGWQTFFDFGDGEVRPNKRIDTSISSPLFRLPSFTIDRGRSEDLGPTSLATRNLLRHITWELPSGQDIANAMGVPQLGGADLSELDQFGANLTASTPLWYYLLKEAEVITDGLTLGPAGGRIVAEVFTTLLLRDPTSFLNQEPTWRPTLPSTAGNGQFQMTDLLTVAGVDPTSRGQ